jgi:hypothetical protein
LNSKSSSGIYIIQAAAFFNGSIGVLRGNLKLLEVQTPEYFMAEIALNAHFFMRTL